MLSHLGIPATEMTYETIDDESTILKPGHLYILSDFFDKSTMYWFVYIKSNGSKVFILKDFKFPYYVNEIKRFEHEDKEFIAFSKGFPEDKNNFDYDVVLQESMIQDTKIWLLCKDIDITFPKENCMYAWFDVKVCFGLAKLSIRKPRVRDVKQYQRPTSLLKYPGSESECSFFIDFKVLKTPELPQEYKEPVFTNKKLKAIESDFVFTNQPKTQEELLEEKIRNEILDALRKRDEEKYRNDEIQQELQREKVEGPKFPSPLDMLQSFRNSATSTPKPMMTQFAKPPPNKPRVPVGGNPATSTSNEVKNNKPPINRKT